MTNPVPAVVPALAARRGAPAAVCVPLVATGHAGLRAELEFVCGLRPDLIEWRADFFDGIAYVDAVLAALTMIRQAAGAVPLLFTIRSAREGGQPSALSAQAVAMLQARACASGNIDLIDVEMAVDAVLFAAVRAASRRNGVGLVGSFHDFQATPDAPTLQAHFARAHALDADLAKVAVMPQRPDDVLTLLAATLQASRELPLPLISMAMGPLGAMTRVVGWRFGSTVTFAAGQGRSAPGQLPVQELRAAMAVLASSGD